MGAVSTDLRCLKRKLRRSGWRVVENRRHLRAYPPDGGRFVVIPSTPHGGHRTWQNILADLRRGGYREAK